MDKYAIWEKQYVHVALQFRSTGMIFWAWFCQLLKYIPPTTDVKLALNKQTAVGCRTV